METASEKGMWGSSAAPRPHPPAAHPMPQLHDLYFLLFFLTFLSSSPLAFKIMKLCCGPYLSFSSCSPWWCMGE
ncbi:hypothetical protein MC885_019703, partial [Smutsia gigantea]